MSSHHVGSTDPNCEKCKMATIYQHYQYMTSISLIISLFFSIGILIDILKDELIPITSLEAVILNIVTLLFCVVYIPIFLLLWIFVHFPVYILYKLFIDLEDKPWKVVCECQPIIGQSQSDGEINLKDPERELGYQDCCKVTRSTGRYYCICGRVVVSMTNIRG